VFICVICGSIHLMSVIGKTAALTPGGAATQGYIGLQIPGTPFLGLLALPGTALLLGQGAPTPGPDWVGKTAAQTI
jgi:hypothetical protein